MDSRIVPFLRQCLACGIRGLIVLACLGSGGCKKSAPAKVTLTPLQTLVNTDTTLSLFHRLIIQGNEAGLLNDNSVTLLLPTNAAFRAAGYTEAGIDTLGYSIANNLVQYLFIPSRISPDSSSYASYPTLTGNNVYGMTDNTQQIWFNGVPVTGKGTTVGNALVYRLSLSLQGPADSLPQLLGSDSSLSFLAEAFHRTNLYDSLFLSGSYTLLAPTNSAFMAAGYDSIGAIDSANFNTLVNLLEYHMTRGSNFTNTLMGLPSIPTYSGGSIAVSVAGGILRFSGGSNPVPANWLSGNMTAGNTIIVHRIDQVLSP